MLLSWEKFNHSTEKIGEYNPAYAKDDYVDDGKLEKSAWKKLTDIKVKPNDTADKTDANDVNSVKTKLYIVSQIWLEDFKFNTLEYWFSLDKSDGLNSHEHHIAQKT